MLRWLFFFFSLNDNGKMHFDNMKYRYLHIVSGQFDDY